MKVATWGNSLAFRIPAELVAALDLAPGDEVEVFRDGDHGFTVRKDQKRLEAIQKMDSMSFSLPENYVFNREEIHER